TSCFPCLCGSGGRLGNAGPRGDHQYVMAGPGDKRFRGAVLARPALVRSAAMLARTLDVATSFGASAARLGAGMAVGTAGKRPVEPLVLYDFEACPFCRKA